MASNSTTLATAGGYARGFTLSISWSENGTSVTDNTSNITATATLSKYYATYWVTNAGALKCWWHDNKNNTDVLIGERVIEEIGYNNDSQSVGGTFNVSHKDDGTLSGYAWAQWVAYSSYGGYPPVSGSVGTGWVALTTIARKSVPSLSVNSISIPASSGSFTINTNRKSSTFTHTLALTAGSTTIATYTGVGASKTVNIADIDDAILATIPNDTSATVVITCTTYNGSTSIGSNTVNLTANTNTGAAPTFSNFTFADTNATTTAITGNNAYLISGKSTLTATISSANKATANYSATMSTYTFAINGQSATENYSTSTITKNLGAVTLASSETTNTTKDLVVSAIDSRGYNTAVTKAVNLVPYQSPRINATATRQNGFENTTTIKIGGTVSRIEVNGTAKNTVNASSGVQYRYKAASTTTWGSWTSRASTLDTSTGKITTSDFSLNLDNQTAYDFEVKITDRLETTTASFQVSVGQPAFYIGEDGRIGIGGMPTIAKIAGEQGLLDVKGRIFTNGREVGTGGDLPDNIVLWDEEQSTPEPETPWVTKSMVDFDSFGIFSNDIAITNGSVRVARFGKFGIILGKSINFTYTGTYSPVSVSIPTSVLPAGATILQTQATTCNHTVDDNQWTHGIGSMTAGASGTTLSFALLSGNSVSKSCAVAFVLFFIEQ